MILTETEKGAVHSSHQFTEGRVVLTDTHQLHIICTYGKVTSNDNAIEL